MLNQLIRRQFLWTLLIFGVVLSGTHFLSRFLLRMDRVDMLQHQLAVYKYMVEKSPGVEQKTVEEINAVNTANGSPVRLSIVFPGQMEYDEQPRGPGGPPNGGPGGPPPMFGPGFGPGIGSPGGEPFRSIQLAGKEPRKLVLKLGRPPDGRGPMLMTMLIFFAVVLASFLSVVFFFWRFREKAEVAKSVLSRMQQGDLQARFPTSRWDDAGQILRLFNEMADEIERLVQSLRDNEKARTHLLQDLAHDLRTPVASLANLLEGLDEEQGALDPESRRELTSLAQQETNYLTRLVEDLLFLALVIEPKYKEQSHQVAVQDLLQQQLQAVANTKKVRLTPIFSSPSSQNLINGNPHLLTRLLRNALENAASFAKSEVQVLVTDHGETVELEVRDDGPGFSPESLESFGKKRATRYMSAETSGRLSVGLGSVIMSAIALAHGGSISVRNGDNGGAIVRIVLRKSPDAVPT